MLIPLAVKVPTAVTQAGALAFERARRRADVKLDVLAHLMGIPYQQLQQQAQGNGHLSTWRLLMLMTDVDGRRFLGYFLQEQADLIGIEDLDGIAARLEDMRRALVSRRMAKADLTPSQSGRRSA